MPFKDDDKRNTYMRGYMAKRRAAARPKGAAPSKAEVARLRARVAVLEAELAAARQQHAKPQPVKNERSTPRGPTSTFNRADEEARMRTLFEADARERAQWGDRPRVRVEGDINRLLVHKVSDGRVKETIIEVMLRHVGEQANIERGIPRRAYRKVLADLHTDRNAGNSEAFIAFKKLDAKSANGKPNPNSIIIADDKVETMTDVRRKSQERSDKGRAAAAKRKAKQ